MLKTYLASMAFAVSATLFAQDYFPKNDGVHTENKNYTAFTNAKLFISPSQVIEQGTLLIQEGKIIASGTGINIPKNAVIIDVSGKSIYPSFIDIYSNFGITAPEAKPSDRKSGQYDPSRTGYYWNDHVMPEKHALNQFNYNAKDASELLKAGFGVVNSHIPDGIIRGTGVLVALNNEQGNHYRILEENSGQFSSFKRSKTSKQSYPNSLLGSMALLKQLFIDADWYAAGNIETKDLSLEAFNTNKNLVQFFDAGSRSNIMRADKIGDANGVQYVMYAGGDEYERVKDVKASNAKLILPLNFPDAYDVEDPFLASELTLSAMRAWNQRPSNPKILADNDITFAITTHGITPDKAIKEQLKSFKENLLKAIAAGLPKEKALESLTTIPAQILGQEQLIGTLEKGHLANFILTSGDVFDTKTTIYENWVQGNRTIFEAFNKKDITGNYNFTLNNNSYTMAISGELEKPKIEVKLGDIKLTSKITYKDEWVNIAIGSKDSTKQEFTRIAAFADNDRSLKGKYILPNGTEFPLQLSATGTETNNKDSKTVAKSDATKIVVPVTYPNKAFGFSKMPQAETILFKNATVWTNENEGILPNTDVLIKDGKIAKIGKNLSNTKATVIDATGKHLTAGIIDEHSHIAADAINESGQNSSAEVSIEDVLNESDISIYRDLAGGVTSIQILHGSANPIGGRSAIIKLKWGASADNLIYQNAPKFIKFALGENIKQSNWGNGRFPQTRMGVEQLYIDYFTRAQAYNNLKKSGKPFKKDLELEALGEILNKERFITCHSYVQSEINMMMKVAEKFNFNINTFTHILEGYKVADKMVDHGVGGSTFSDWWAYKFEVNDAIPYNASIMHNAGVTVAINSDDAEMSRRLNQEAAKIIKYGGVSEEEAWKFVTLNPAKLLHIDNRVGSIKVGKDADVVLWSNNPLSIYAKAEKTIIEGVTYFDVDRDKLMREAQKSEKSQLINMMLQSKNKGDKTQAVKKKEQQHLHCNTIENHI